MPCSICRKKGHNVRTCKMMKEKAFQEIQEKKEEIDSSDSEPECDPDSEPDSEPDNDPDILELTKKTKDINLDDYGPFLASIEEFEANQHYRNLMCLKETSFGPKSSKNDPFIEENISLFLENRSNLKHSCILPIGHDGKCSHHFENILVPSKQTDKLINSIKTAIYYTPGNDDYIYKNRSNRLYHKVLSSVNEKKLRNKEIKRKCAIPLKDCSTAILLAQAYVDWMTYIMNISDIKLYLDKKNKNFKPIMKMIELNKIHLKKFYKNREIFNKKGNTICVITKEECKLINFSDTSRDNRLDCFETDIQIGHNFSRSDKYVSIRGENLLPMSRRGNLIIGEYKFTDDIWIDKLRNLVNKF